MKGKIKMKKLKDWYQETIPTLAQCHYCDKDKLGEYYNLLFKYFAYSFGYTDPFAIDIVEKYQIVRDRMLQENLMCSLLLSKIREYKQKNEIY